MGERPRAKSRDAGAVAFCSQAVMVCVPGSVPGRPLPRRDGMGHTLGGKEAVDCWPN